MHFTTVIMTNKLLLFSACAPVIYSVTNLI